MRLQPLYLLVAKKYKPSFKQTLHRLEKHSVIHLIFLSWLIVAPQFAQSQTLSTEFGLTNHYEKFTLTATVTGTFVAGGDDFVITFDNDVILPASIATSAITVSNGIDTENPSSVSISGQAITIPSPVEFKNNGPPAGRITDLTIVISASAKIRNPSSPVTGLTVDLSDAATASYTYNVTQSSTTVSAAAVTPNTAVEGRTTKYTMTFSVGQGGYLTAGVSSITLTLPSGTTVPSGTVSGVTINSTNASTVGDATARTLTMTVPVTVDNEGSVTVIFSKTSGVKNPNQGTYTLTVETSSEPSAVASSSYSIASAADLSFAAINAGDNTVNATSSYEITFVLSTPNGGLEVSPGGGNPDRVEITFPSGFSIPTSISGSNVTFFNLDTGFSGSPSSVTVSANTVSFPVPVNAGAGVEVTTTFNSSVGIVNPAVPGSYQLTATTEQDDGTTIDAAANSNPFSIFASNSTISSVNVSPSSSIASATGVSYTITGVTGSNGRLVEDSEVEITFPSGTGYGTLTGQIEGTNTAAPSRSGDVVTLVVPNGVEVGNGSSFEIVIGDITNPAAGSYTLDISSSAEPTAETSNGYTLGLNSLTAATVTMQGGNNITNSAGDYDIALTGATQLNGPSKNNQYIRVQFPTGTTVPSSIATTDVRLNGAAAGTNVGSVTTNTTSRTVDVLVNSNNFTPTAVRFLTSAGILNPTVAATGFYTLQVSTAEQTSPVTSGTYDLAGSTNSPTVNSVSASPNTYNASPQLTINFTTSPIGAIKGGAPAGSDVITVDFDSLVTVPASISNSFVKIDNVAAASVSTTSGAGGSIEITMPAGSSIGNSTAATIVILDDAGLTLGDDSPNATANSTVTVSTTNDQTASAQTNNLTLQDAIDLSVGNVSLSDNKKNATSAYTINVTLGTSGALAQNDTIAVTFPSSTFVPETIEKSRVLVNGSNPPNNPRVAGNVINIPTPAALSGETSFTVQFSANAGLINPQAVSTYTLDVSTTAETTAATSNSYSIIDASSTVSQASVVLSDNNPTTTNVTYTVNFSTGSNGRLVSGSSKIFVTFPSGTAYGTVTVDVNSVGTGNVTFAQFGDEFQITVPTANDFEILNSDNIELVFTGITNPTTENDYSLNISTSIETSIIPSSTYEISSIGPVSFVASPNDVTVGSNQVNAITTYNFAFDNTVALTAGSSTITITFPSGSLIPATIAATEITITGNATGVNPSAVTTNINNRTVTMTVPAGFAEAGTSPNIQVAFTASAGVSNPKEPGSYTYHARTSEQTINATSPSTISFIQASSSLSGLTVSATPETASEPVNWTWNFTTGSQGALQSGVGTITLDFGQSVFENASVPASAVFVEGVNPTTISTTAPNVTITVPNSVTIGNNTNVTVTLNTGAGIRLKATLVKAAPGSSSAPSTADTDTYSVDTSSEQGASQTSNPLPIELASFSIKQDAVRKTPVLEWVTATEFRNFGFEIERKEASSETWTHLGFIAGAGTTYQQQHYQFEDTQLQESGLFEYRMIQIDYDGTETIYGPLEFNKVAPKQFELKEAYPNPFNPSTTIQYTVADQRSIKLHVYDITGRLVARLAEGEKPAGTYTVQFDASRLASGVYLIQYVAGTQSFVKKAVLIK